MTILTALAPPRKISCFDCLFGCSGVPTHDLNHHLWSAVPHSRALTPIYSPPNLSTCMNTHHGYVFTSLTLNCMHVMLLRILAHVAMWRKVFLRACLVCLSVCFGAFPLYACPNPKPEHMRSCCSPFLDFF